MGCVTALFLATSCTAESIEDAEASTMNDGIHPVPGIIPPPPPPNDNGDDDRDKDKVKG